MSKAMETITFPGGSEPYQVRDGRIPENPGNYQYLVTDGEGQWGTADRLAWEETDEVKNYLSGFNPLTFTGTDYIHEPTMTWLGFIQSGTQYNIDLDGETYQAKAYGGSGYVYLEVPDVIYISLNNDGGFYEEIRAYTSGEHTLSVYTIKSNTTVQTMAPKFLPSGVPVVPVTSADNGKFLQVVNGAWAAVAVTDVSQEGA